MFNHEPSGYECPFCCLLAGSTTETNTQDDIVRRAPLATALASPRWWPNNLAHIIVVCNGHYENLYDIPAENGHAVHDLTHEVAIALRRTYQCDGISTRQHNEPAGNQDVWHYHVHVFPRYHGDKLYESRSLPGFVTSDTRKPYVEMLRNYFLVEDREGGRYG